MNLLNIMMIFQDQPHGFQPHTNPDGTTAAVSLYRLNGDMPKLAIHPTATIRPGLKVMGDVLIGPNVEIGEDVDLVGPLVLEEGVKVAHGALIHPLDNHRSVIGSQAYVGNKSTLQGSLGSLSEVGDDSVVTGTIPPGTLIGNGCSITWNPFDVASNLRFESGVTFVLKEIANVKDLKTLYVKSGSTVYACNLSGSITVGDKCKLGTHERSVSLATVDVPSETVYVGYKLGGECVRFRWSLDKIALIQVDDLDLVEIISATSIPDEAKQMLMALFGAMKSAERERTQQLRSELGRQRAPAPQSGPSQAAFDALCEQVKQLQYELWRTVGKPTEA